MCEEILSISIIAFLVVVVPRISANNNRTYRNNDLKPFLSFYNMENIGKKVIQVP